jgi:hypothetical protein
VPVVTHGFGGAAEDGAVPTRLDDVGCLYGVVVEVEVVVVAV